jgi:hypothetical protein
MSLLPAYVHDTVAVGARQKAGLDRARHLLDLPQGGRALRAHVGQEVEGTDGVIGVLA